MEVTEPTLMICWDISDVLFMGLPSSRSQVLVIPLLPLLALQWMILYPQSFKTQTQATEDQIRDIKLRRYLVHDAFFVLFEIPGWYRVELTRRAEETEIRSFMLQLLFMATLHAAKLVRPAAQPFVKEITEEMLQALYLGYWQSSTKSTLYYQWPMSEDIEVQQEDHLTLAVARLLHVTKSHANPVTNITEQLIQQEDLPRSESNETSEEEEIPEEEEMETEDQEAANNPKSNSENQTV